MIDARVIRSANIHVTGACNYRCEHCFDTCLAKSVMSPGEWEPRLLRLKSMGVTKINLAGGEPMLYPRLPELCCLAKSMGFTVSMVSNGSLITESSLAALSGTMDWLGLSVDSSDEGDEMAIGRHAPGIKHLDHVREVSGWAHDLGIRVKLNITVVRRSWDKDFHGLICDVSPERTKALRALTLAGANDGRPDTWSITDWQFSTFRSRHSDVPGMVFEDNADMIGTYLMLDPLGRLTLNSGGVKRFVPFDLLLEEGAEAFVDAERYYGRGAVYRWRD